MTRSVKSLIARLTTTGSRPIGRWLPPSMTRRSAPVWRTTVSNRPTGWQRSSVPWMTSTGHSTERSTCSVSSMVEAYSGAS